MKPHVLTLGLVLLWAGILQGGQADASAPVVSAPVVSAPAAPAEAADRAGLANALLQPGDRLRFAVREDPEATADVVVNASGQIDVPLIGLWTVAGKSIEQVTAETKQALEAEFLVKATVRLIFVDRPDRPRNRGRVFLAGQMRKIGAVEIDLAEKNTVGRVILANGGLADFADARRIKIIRKEAPGAELETLFVDLEEVLKKGRIDKDVVLLDGDFVIADAKLINW